MTPFDRRWQHLAEAARRAPVTPLPNETDRLLPRAVPPCEDQILPRRLGWVAATSLLACALSVSWMADFLAPLDLAPPTPTLPTLPRPPRLPPPPTLPDVRSLVQSLTFEESVR